MEGFEEKEEKETKDRVGCHYFFFFRVSGGVFLIGKVGCGRVLI